MDIKIDTKATLDRFTEAGIYVKSWVESRGFSRRRFYNVINNETMVARAPVARRLFKALQQEGLLVLAPPPKAEDKPD